MPGLIHHFELAAPLFVLVLLGFALARSGRFPKAVSDALAKFVFAVALPALLFALMSDLARLPAVDPRVPVAYFGACFLVFIFGRVVARVVFRMDGASQSVFALGGVFSNNVLLGVPIAKLALGDAAMPAVATVLVFNALLLWTLVTVSVEWARHGEFSVKGIGKTARNVLTNPIVAAILIGAAFGLTGLKLPALLAQPLALIGQSAAPLALVVLGMGLVEFGVKNGWREGLAISALKLAVAPLAVWVLARLLGLSPLNTQTVVLMASLSVGVNVYLMAREFDVAQAPVASSIVLSTAGAAISVPLALTLVGA
jgi:predicted permease